LDLGSDLLEQQHDTSGESPLDILPSFDDVCELVKIGSKIDRKATVDFIDGTRNIELRAYLLAELAAGMTFAQPK